MAQKDLENQEKDNNSRSSTIWDSEKAQRAKNNEIVDSNYERTSDNLAKRKREIAEMIEKKADRSTSEYLMKADVLKNKFTDSLKSLIDRV